MTKELLSKILDLKFTDEMAERNGYIMRKEIMPMIKSALTV